MSRPASSAATRLKRISKADYKAAIPDLRVRLVNAQYRLRESEFNVVVLLAGPDRAGCEQVGDRLQEWMDARYLDIWFWGVPTVEERARPGFWRYWRAMPRHGRTGIFAGAWIIQLAAAAARGEVSGAQFRRRMDWFNNFDRMLAANGTVMLKLWLDLSRGALRRRLQGARNDPDLARYVEPGDWELYSHYAASARELEGLLEASGRAVPWTVIDATRERDRDLAVARAIATAIEARLDRPAPPPSPPAATGTPDDHLARVDLSAALPYRRYRRSLDRLQVRLHRLSLEARRVRLGSVLVFEGWDAAGKGGMIRRITQAISARDAKVHMIAAPTPEERVHNYMWRFWQRLPADGRMAIFDRSWYGRVLVERVEGFARPDEWQRAYDEINDFEAQIVDHGQPLLKFWLHIDPDEQLRRFEARRDTPYKKYKLTDEDLRNRDKWAAYAAAVNAMIERTSTATAPWELVAANDKRHARVTVLRTLCERLEARLDAPPA